jgi:hypothetical protein
MRGISVVLDRDTQLLVPEIEAVHLPTVDGADGDVRLRYGKPQVDNQPEQQLSEGDSARPVARSTSLLPMRVPRGSGRSCSRSRRRRRNAGRFGSGSRARASSTTASALGGQTVHSRSTTTRSSPRTGRPCRSSRSSTSAQPLWRTMPSRSPLRCS